MTTETNFWISDDVFNEDIPIESRKEMYRSSIKNFVKIVTEREIPVQFKENESCTDGKTIWIDEYFSVSSLDSTVGIVLHESCHIIHSDFDLFKTLWMKIPKEANTIAKSKNLDVSKLPALYKKLLNYVEDRFIDDWAYEKFIGYRGYYQDLYSRFWNNKKIGDTLTSNNFRDETVDSYLFRIINLTNKKTDLTALNGLHKIYKILNLDNVSRLKTPVDRLNVAKDILIVVLENVEKMQSDSLNASNGCGDILEACEKWNDGNYERIESDVDEKENVKNKTDDLTSHKKYEDEFVLDSDVKCILIKNINKTNLESLNLPIALKSSLFTGNLGNEPVNHGIILGKILASKWKIRGESSKTVSNRQKSGKIDKRLLYSVGFDNDRIFTRQKTEFYKKCHIHISIDASGSMRENNYGKWKNSIICAVAIAKAASVTENVEIVISFRTTIMRDEVYPCLVIAYDSRKDKFNKIYSIFPSLHPGGGTPEGLLFPLISSETPESTYEMDSIFINFSDGMPHFAKKGVNFCGAGALLKTNKYFNKFKRDKGMVALCYYIGEDIAEKIAFALMYGKDSNFIDVKQIVEVSKTITKKVLNNKKIL